jgi:hypothetical protein
MTSIHRRGSSARFITMSETPPVSASPVATVIDDDPLAHLKKMSTTAGLGTSDYVAINPLAIVTLLLGLASALVILSDIFLIVPLAGVVCGILAIRQVRDSAGTQTGRGFALAGLVISVLVAGGGMASRAVKGWGTRTDEQQIADVLSTLSKNLHDKKYHDAYLLFSDRFKARVTEQRFTDAFKSLDLPEAGGLQSISWNGVAVFDNTDSGMRLASVGVFLRFEKSPEPGRHAMGFMKTTGPWQIDDFSIMFPAEKAKRGKQQR